MLWSESFKAPGTWILQHTKCNPVKMWGISKLLPVSSCKRCKSSSSVSLDACCGKVEPCWSRSESLPKKALDGVSESEPVPSCHLTLIMCLFCIYPLEFACSSCVLHVPSFAQTSKATKKSTGQLDLVWEAQQGNIEERQVFESLSVAGWFRCVDTSLTIAPWLSREADI